MLFLEMLHETHLYKSNLLPTFNQVNNKLIIIITYYFIALLTNWCLSLSRINLLRKTK